MKRPLVWKNPEIWIDCLFLFLVYCLSSAAMKSELDTFFLRKKKNKNCFNKERKKTPMCSRWAILKVWNTSATTSSEQSGGESSQSHFPVHLCLCWSLGSLTSQSPSPSLSFWEMLLEQLGQAQWIWHFQPKYPALVMWCHLCVSDKGHCCHTLLFWGMLSLTQHCWCLGPSQPASCPWSSSGRSWIHPQGTLLQQKPPPTTKVEWNTKYLIPLRKERDVFILFCLFLYELEVFSNPVCWLQ